MLRSHDRLFASHSWLLKVCGLCVLYTSICLPLRSQGISGNANRDLITWQPEQRLTFDSSQDFTPRVIAQGDTFNVFWSNEFGMVMYIRSSDEGFSWSSPRSVYSNLAGNAGSTYRIVGDGEDIYVLWQTCDTCQGNPNNYWVTLRRSTDAGFTFEPYRLMIPGDPGSITAKDSCVVYEYLSSEVGFINVSLDHGLNWNVRPLQFRNFQELKLANRLLHLVQPAQGTSRLEVSYSYSTDLGTSWRQETILSTIDIYPSDETQVDETGDGKVIVVWNDGKYGSTDGFHGSIIVRRSVDTARTWEPEVLLTNIPSAGYPRMAVENRLVGIVWDNANQPFRGISLHLSTNSGDSWIPEFAVTDTTIPAGDHDVSISRDRIAVVWSDSRTGNSQVYLRQGSILSTDVKVDNAVPLETVLSPSYPNPFNSQTIVPYTLNVQTHISLTVFDVLGREVAELFDGVREPGEYRAVFDGTSLSSGIYFVRLLTDQRSIVRSMLLIR